MKSIINSVAVAAYFVTGGAPAVMAQEAAPKQAAIIEAIGKGDLAAVKEAAEKDPASVKSAARYGSNALIYATQRGHKDIVSFLLEKGADPTLALATAVENRNKEIVALLLEKGADVNQDTQNYGYGSSILDRALGYSENLEVAALLVAKGFDLEKRDREGKTILLRRIGQGSARANIEWLVDKGAKVNVRDDRGTSSLDLAISNGNADMVSVLLDNGADVKYRDDNGRSPLHAAVTRGNATVVKAVLDKGADINDATDAGDTPLHLAAAAPGALLGTLLDAGANPNARNKRGDTALHIALRAAGEPYAYNVPRTNRYEGGDSTPAPVKRPDGTLLKLLDKSVISAKDGLGLTPLLLAITMRDVDSRDVIMERKPKVDSTTSLFDAVAQGDIVNLEKILTAKPFLVYFRLPSGLTPLHIAALWGTRGAAEALLKRGADTNARDADGASPLMMTCARGSGVYTKRSRLMAAMLLSKGAEVNARDRNDATALHRAVALRDDEMTLALLIKGAEAGARDKNGQSPLHLLATGGPATDAIVQTSLAKKLLKAKANPNVRTVSGATPLSIAVGSRRLDFVRLLLDNGANPDIRDSGGVTPLGRLVSSWSSYSSSSDSGVSKVNKDMAALLLDKGADPNARTDYNGDNLLTRAISNSNKEVVALLIAKKANLETRNSNGYTPLMVSVNSGNNTGMKDIVEQLVTAGANVNAKNQSGETVLKMAKRSNNKEIIALLEGKGATE